MFVRKLLAVLLSMLLLMSIVTAVAVENESVGYGLIYTEGLNNDPNAQAGMLRALGLFMGSDKGYELERTLTRAEAAVILARVLYGEQAVQLGSSFSPFADVPEWAAYHVGALYQNGVTKGVSETQFGAAQNITCWQFATLLCRAMQGDDDIYFQLVTEHEVSAYDDSVPVTPFLRQDAVALLTRALKLQYTAEGQWDVTLAQHLLDRGAYTYDSFRTAAAPIYNEDYTYLNDHVLALTLAGVPVKTAPRNDLDILYESFDINRDYFYATTLTEDTEPGAGVWSLYQVARSDLRETKIREMHSTASVYFFVDAATDDTKSDYLLERNADMSYLLLRVTDGQAEVVDTQGPLFEGEGVYTDYLVSDHRATEYGIVLLDGTNLWYVHDGEAKLFATDKGGRLVDFDGVTVVYEIVASDNTEICSMNVLTGESAGRFRVLNKLPEYGGRDLRMKSWDYLYGDAGVYCIDPETHRLTQITDRPTSSLTFCRYGAGSVGPFILTHPENKMVPGIDKPGGDEIWLIDVDGYHGEKGAEILVLDSGHGIAIAEIWGVDSAIFFNAGTPQGMGHYDEFVYVLLHDPENDNPLGVDIFVNSYTAGRGEMETQSAEETRYAEQVRLIELGYASERYRKE